MLKRVWDCLSQGHWVRRKKNEFILYPQTKYSEDRRTRSDPSYAESARQLADVAKCIIVVVAISDKRGQTNEPFYSHDTISFGRCHLVPPTPSPLPVEAT